MVQFQVSVPTLKTVPTSLQSQAKKDGEVPGVHRARQGKMVEFQVSSTYLLLQSQTKKDDVGVQYLPCCYRARQRKMVEFQVSITYLLLQSQAKKDDLGVQYLPLVTEPDKER